MKTSNISEVRNGEHMCGIYALSTSTGSAFLDESQLQSFTFPKFADALLPKRILKSAS